MKSISWNLANGGVMTLSLAETTLLTIYGADTDVITVNVTKEDLEGMDDILTDGKYFLERAENKKREELERLDLEKRKERFKKILSGGATISELFRDEAGGIKAKMDAASKDLVEQASKKTEENLERKEESNAG